MGTRIRRHTLRRPVRIEGHDLLGRYAALQLVPVEESGWFLWMYTHPVPLTADMLRLGRGFMMIEFGELRLRICEHLLALRSLAHVESICIVPETAGIPFDAGLELYWRAIEPHLIQEGCLVPYEFPERVCSDERPLAAGESRFVQYCPTGNNTNLQMQIASRYPAWGTYHTHFSFPNDFEKVMAAHAFIGSVVRQRAARAAAQFGWPHVNKFLWPNGRSAQDMLELEAKHRAVDTGGDFGLLAPPGHALVGLIDSWRGGHRDDANLVEKMLTREKRTRTTSSS